VKCNETKPTCNQCSRLNLGCQWFRGGQKSIKISRQGHGPLKSRSHWTPTPIAPKLSGDLIAECPVRPKQLSFPTSQLRSDSLDTASESDANFKQLEVNGGSLHLVIPYAPMSSHGDMGPFGDPQYIMETDHYMSNYFSIDCCPSVDFFEPGPTASLLGYEMPLPNSLKLSNHEHEALRHYQTTYSLYRTTKDPNWSTHKVLLRIGSYDKMIMHLLLAVSLHDYAVRTGHNGSIQEAKVHFRKGAQALANMSAIGTRYDEVVMMAAYFFIYLYMSKRKSTTPEQLNQLSLTVLSYVQKHDLIVQCAGSYSLSIQQTAAKDISSSHGCSLLARLIMWTFDEDVKCSFQGTGGHFARYLSGCKSSIKEIYDTSKNALVDHWGKSYPYSQVLDDDQNSTVLEFLWVLMALWQDINDLSHTFDESPLRERIEQKFRVFEEVCAHLLCSMRVF
jgi:hypothetical protein